MATFRIPPRYQPGFELLIGLSKDSGKKLLSQLHESSELVDIDELTKKITLPNLEPDDIKQILDSLLSMFTFKESTELSAAQFTSELLEALSETKIDNLVPNDNFRDFINELLKLTDISLYLNAKAKHLTHENNYVILESRIFTDIRPIFTEDIDCKLRGYVILHNLKLEYSEGSDYKEAFFTLDKDDLEKLKENINRAETKEKIIREEIKEKNINIFN